MQLTYWKKFDKVFKHFSGKKIYEEILKLVDLLGEPYKKKSNKGRKFKITPKEYTAIIAFKISSRDNFRDMELDSELYVDEHIDHSTFGKNFFKIPYDYCACSRQYKNNNRQVQRYSISGKTTTSKRCLQTAHNDTKTS